MALLLRRLALVGAVGPPSCVALKTQKAKLNAAVDPVHEAGVPPANHVKAVRRTEDASRARLPTGEASVMDNCAVVSEQLRTRNDTSLAAEFWDIACNDRYECGARLPDMTNGCMYVSSNIQMHGLLASIGRPSPCSFRDMFINSFFKQGECPSEHAQGEVTSHGGVTYSRCDGGLVTHSATCTKAALVGGEGALRSPGDGFVDVFVVDAVIGLPAPWEKIILKRTDTRHPFEDIVDDEPVDDAEKPPRPVTVEFHVCAMKNQLTPHKEMVALCKQQVTELQEAHRGNASCVNPVYDFPVTPTGISFADFNELTDLHYIINPIMCASVDFMYSEIWASYMHEERGKAKVLLADPSSVLGISAFPGDGVRGTMINYRSMPGGGMHKYDQGKTLIHELGHYFGLFHTFQDGCLPGDLVADTDAEDQPFFGCPSESKIPRTCGEDTIDPVHNFMDYEDDRCMCSYTPGQVERLKKVGRKHIFKY